MKKYCFTVDDNIRFFKEITQKNYNSIFDHPYLALYKQLHQKYDLKIQLNLFYEMEGFTLADFPDRYASEWKENAHWLKLSFHSRLENVNPYISSGYDEVYRDCKSVQDQILRFAGSDSLAATTTVHYCQTTPEGVKALADNGVLGLLGLFGTQDTPQTSYSLPPDDADKIRAGEITRKDGVAFGGIDLILNKFDRTFRQNYLTSIAHRDTVKVMIHEQYFYPDYPAYLPDFAQRLEDAFSLLRSSDFVSCFFEQLL